MNALIEDATIRWSLRICFVVVGGFFAWASFAPLAEGVVAHGKVSVQNQRKTVQHLEGGIIQKILVSEGDVVEAGQPLIVLADIAVLAGRDQVAQALAIASASVERLEALLAGRDVAELPAFEHLPLEASVVDEIRARHHRLFVEQHAAIAAHQEVLVSRRATMQAQATANGQEIQANQHAQALIVDEVSRAKALLEQQLIRGERVVELERDLAQLVSDEARLQREQVTAVARAREIEREMAQARAKAREQISQELVEARAEVLAHTEKLSAAQDVVDRTTVYAPQAGTVLNLMFSTARGVVKPGEPILEIVPSDTALVATVNIRPVDREAIYEGLLVDARLASTNSWHAGLFEGRVEGISADLKTSVDGELSYYEAQISLSQKNKDIPADVHPLPGMPVEAFVYSGRTRTFLEYLSAPLLTTMRRGARE